MAENHSITEEGLVAFKRPVSIEEIWDVAKQAFEAKVRGEHLADPGAAANYIASRIGLSENAKFIVVFLTKRHRVIACETLFEGTIDRAEVHPREVVKRALALNAEAVIAAHNHVSGDSVPTPSDIAVMTRLREALSLVDIRLLDHFIVTGTKAHSMAVRGHV